MRPFAILAALAFLAGCATLTPQITVERDLMEADRAFAALSQEKGMAAAFAAYVDPAQGLMIVPGEMYEGAPGVAKAFADTPADRKLTWVPDRAFAAESGDMGVTTGRFTRSAAGADTAHGRYVTVWRKNAAGQWKALIDIGNTDPGAVAPVAPPTPVIEKPLN
jgi:ketosteroid isomerase-like protein